MTIAMSAINIKQRSLRNGHLKLFKEGNRQKRQPPMGQSGHRP
jgi:hypothetical protein